MPDITPKFQPGFLTDRLGFSDLDEKDNKIKGVEVKESKPFFATQRGWTEIKDPRPGSSANKTIWVHKKSFERFESDLNNLSEGSNLRKHLNSRSQYGGIQEKMNSIFKSPGGTGQTSGKGASQQTKAELGELGWENKGVSQQTKAELVELGWTKEETSQEIQVELNEKFKELEKPLDFACNELDLLVISKQTKEANDNKRAEMADFLVEKKITPKIYKQRIERLSNQQLAILLNPKNPSLEILKAVLKDENADLSKIFGGDKVQTGRSDKPTEFKKMQVRQKTGVRASSSPVRVKSDSPENMVKRDMNEIRSFVKDEIKNKKLGEENEVSSTKDGLAKLGWKDGAEVAKIGEEEKVDPLDSLFKNPLDFAQDVITVEYGGMSPPTANPPRNVMSKFLVDNKIGPEKYAEKITNLKNEGKLANIANATNPLKSLMEALKD